MGESTTKQKENVKLANVSFLDSAEFGSKNTEVKWYWISRKQILSPSPKTQWKEVTKSSSL